MRLVLFVGCDFIAVLVGVLLDCLAVAEFGLYGVLHFSFGVLLLLDDLRWICGMNVGLFAA